MSQTFMEGADYLVRACFEKPRTDEAAEVLYKENGSPKVYPRRWLVLTSYCLNYFFWNVSSLRVRNLIFTI